MMQVQSDKKNFSKKLISTLSASYVRDFVYSFESGFQAHTHNRTEVALQYFLGLLKMEKGQGNMERMEEEIPESEYRAYQHFLSVSNWKHQDIIDKVAMEASLLMEAEKAIHGKATGLIIDESAHLKKGDKSVGVGKQYAGVIGKVENCQVGVYASLVNDTRAALVGEEIFLPESWVKDEDRCRKAGIPESSRVHKTKPELALDIIDRLIERGIKFDWVGGDGLYGHTSQFRQGLEQRGLFFVLDVHKDEKVFFEKPVYAIPEAKSARGRRPKHEKPDIDPIRLDKYFERIANDEALWTEEKGIRKGQKGWLDLSVHKVKVWVPAGPEGQVMERTLIISHKLDGRKEVKYSLSNGGLDQYTSRQYGWFQAQRYWVERTFDDAKNELCMSDYQVRKWKGWHHHHALVFMAGLFLLKCKLDFADEAPLMSVRDARILMIVSLFGTDQEIQNRIDQMNVRHRKRQYDIDRRYIT
jgi:SRSO17 transposase